MHWRWKKPENKGCAGLRRNPAHPLFSAYFLFICASLAEFISNSIFGYVSFDMETIYESTEKTLTK